jgi:hypothetical protein
LIDERERNIKKPPFERRTEEELWRICFAKDVAWRMEMAILKFPGGLLLGIYQTGIPAT